MRRLAAALALLALAMSGAGAGGPGGTSGIVIEATPTEIAPAVLDGLTLRGTMVLTADHAEFGGFSGLEIDNGHMVAVTDRGWWLLADLDDGPDGLRPVAAGIAAMRDPDDRAYGGKEGDAEALTTREGRRVVAFERDHRLMVQQSDGKLGEAIRDDRFEAMPGNGGIEALATTPGGAILMIGEEAGDAGHPMFLLRGQGGIEARTLPKTERHEVTGADLGPDGRLYLVLRDYSVLSGVSIRIHRYDLDGDGWPVVASRAVLGAFESESGIDNMEGIALWRDGAGRTRLTLISDDNFNAVQRTLLMDFEVLE